MNSSIQPDNHPDQNTVHTPLIHSSGQPHPDARALAPEDYVEPACVLCGDPYGKAPEVKPVPQQRIRDKMDEYMGRRDYAGAERHLLYWLEEARLGRDLRGQLIQMDRPQRR